MVQLGKNAVLMTTLENMLQASPVETERKKTIPARCYRTRVQAGGEDNTLSDSEHVISESAKESSPCQGEGLGLRMQGAGRSV